MRMTGHRRRGTTMIEVLMTVSVICMVLSLCVPAVHMARESARRASCASNLKQLGTALHNFHSAHTYLPSSVNPSVPLSAGNAPQPPSISWETFALPYFESQWLYDRLDQTQNWSSMTPSTQFITPNAQLVCTRLSIFECPSAPLPAQHFDGDPQLNPWQAIAAPTDYATVTQVNPQLAALTDSAGNPLIDGAGVGIMPQNTRPSFDQVLDGLSNTILLVESAGRPQLWRRGGVAIGAPPAHMVNGGGWCRPASDIGLSGASLDGTTSPGPYPMNCTNGVDVGGQPYPYPAFTDANRVVSGSGQVYAFHTGGSYVLFADGSVKFVRETVSIRIFADLITRAGGETAGPDDLD